MQYLKTKSKDLVRISLLSNAQFDIFIASKVFISLVELSVLHVVKIVQVTARLSPQNHLLQTIFVFQTISSIIVIRYTMHMICSIDITIPSK